MFSNASGVLNKYVSNARKNEFTFTPMIATNALNSTNVAPSYLRIDLLQYIPKEATSVTMFVTFNKTATGTNNINIGNATPYLAINSILTS